MILICPANLRLVPDCHHTSTPCPVYLTRARFGKFRAGNARRQTHSIYTRIWLSSRHCCLSYARDTCLISSVSSVVSPVQLVSSHALSSWTTWTGLHPGPRTSRTGCLSWWGWFLWVVSCSGNQWRDSHGTSHRSVSECCRDTFRGLMHTGLASAGSKSLSYQLVYEKDMVNVWVCSLQILFVFLMRCSGKPWCFLHGCVMHRLSTSNWGHHIGHHCWRLLATVPGTSRSRGSMEMTTKCVPVWGSPDQEAQIYTTFKLCLTLPKVEHHCQ